MLEAMVILAIAAIALDPPNPDFDTWIDFYEEDD